MRASSFLQKVGSVLLAICLMAGLSVSLSPSPAQAVTLLSFAPAVSYNVGSNPTDLDTGDFNLDGKVDLVSTNLTSMTVSVLLGGNSGVFQNAGSYNDVANPRNTDVEDFDLDGIPDLAVSNGAANHISILIGTGTGTFESVPDGASIGSYSGANHVEAGDFNEDDIPDLIALNGYSGDLFLLMGNGDGTFLLPITLGSAGRFLENFTTGDLNQDNHLDLVIPDINMDTFAVRLGNGNGTFQPKVTYSTGHYPETMIISDLNGDGYADLAGVNSGSTNVSVFLGNGSGTFPAHADYTVSGGSISLTTGDFNFDGYTDIVTANYSNSSFSVLLGNGNGTFQPAINTSSVAGARNVVASDFSADGHADLAITGYTSGVVGVHFNTSAELVGTTIHSVASGSWSSPTTWDIRVPTDEDHVIINAGHTVTLDTDASIQNITIAGTFNGSSHRINIVGNWTNNGAFLPQSGTIAFTGSASTQMLTGSTNSTFTNLVINSGSIVSLTRPITINTNLNLQAGTLNAEGQDITIKGGWTKSAGSFLPASNTVTFDGSGEQTVSGDLVFANLTVGSNAILTTSSSLSLTGTLVNHGWISETKAVSGTGTLSYGLGKVTLNIATQGTLTSLQVMRRDTDHPNNQEGLWQTGRYWSFTPNTGASGFTTSLTLPVDFNPISSYKVCRYTGTAWDCARDSATNSSITRSGITAFSDWTVLTDVATQTVLTSSTNNSRYGESVTFTATVSSTNGIPTGTVEFYEQVSGTTISFGTAILNEEGVATLTLTAPILTAGSHPMRAKYVGAGIHPPSTAVLQDGLLVDKAVLTVKADDLTKTFASDNPPLTYTVSGFAGEENESVLSGQPSLSTSATKQSAIGRYEIKISAGNLYAENYTFEFASGYLIITGKQILLPFITR